MVANDSQESHYIRSAFLSEELGSEPWEDVAKHIGFPMARSTAKNIARKHRDFERPYPITWAIRPAKPRIGPFHEQIREEYCGWAIKQCNEGALFIFSDETDIEIAEPHAKDERFLDLLALLQSTTPSVKYLRNSRLCSGVLAARTSELRGLYTFRYCPKVRRRGSEIAKNSRQEMRPTRPGLIENAAML